jgi:hypothetical protein
MSNTLKYKLLSTTADDVREHRCSDHSAFTGALRRPIIVGKGRQNAKIPTARNFMRTAKKHLRSRDFVLPGAVHDHDQQEVVDFNALFPGMPKVAHFVKPQVPAVPVSSHRLAGHAFAVAMMEDLFTQDLDVLFRDDLDIVTRRRSELPAEMQIVAENIANQLDPMKARIFQVLPNLTEEIKKQYPQARTAQVYQAALQLIAKQLGPVLTTLRLWVESFRQWLDPSVHDKLRLLRAMMEQKVALVTLGTLSGLSKVDNADQITRLVDSEIDIGGLIMPSFNGPFDSGPAVIPLSDPEFGMPGAHLCFKPRNMSKIVVLADNVFDHESGHIGDKVMKGFTEEQLDNLEKRIRADAKSGKLKFPSQFVMIGTQKIPYVEAAVMVFRGQYGELIADLFGILIGGAPAFVECFTKYVAAMSEIGAGDLSKVKVTLRTGSSYTAFISRKNGTVSIRFEPHPQDTVRVKKWIGNAARSIGFTQAADRCIAIAAQESGTPEPTTITWDGEAQEAPDDESSQGQGTAGRKTRGAEASDDENGGEAEQPKLPQIVMSADAWGDISNSVVDALLNTPLNCIKSPEGKPMSLKELVCMTPELHAEKVEPLVPLLKKGIGSLPKDGRHYFFHYIGSASMLAFVQLVDEGMDPVKAFNLVETAGQSMCMELLPAWEELADKLDLYRLKSQRDAGKPLTQRRRKAA